jgi:hypothetical protein
MSRPRRRPSQSRGRNQGRGQGRSQAKAFWRGSGSQEQPAAEKIRPTTDPGAVPRSLGEPPLTPDTAAPHHLAVVYEEAVRTATALAAANGLLQDDEPGEPE